MIRVFVIDLFGHEVAIGNVSIPKTIWRQSSYTPEKRRNASDWMSEIRRMAIARVFSDTITVTKQHAIASRLIGEP